MTDKVKTDKQIEQDKSERIMNGVSIWASFYVFVNQKLQQKSLKTYSTFAKTNDINNAV